MIKEAGDGEGADATDGGSEGGEVGACADFICKIAFQDTVFGGGAGVDDGSAGFYHRISNQPRSPRGCDDYIILVKLCQVRAVMKEGNIVAGVGEHFVKWSTNELAATDKSDFGSV